jgi:hypothetical protein
MPHTIDQLMIREVLMCTGNMDDLMAETGELFT